MRNWFLIAMSIIILGEEVQAQSGAGAPTWRPIVMGKNGMVAAEHPLLADAVETAAHGYAVSAWGAGNFGRSRELLARWESSAKIFLPGGKAREPGDWLIQSDLAKSISAIAERGADEFYRGEIARMTA